MPFQTTSLCASALLFLGVPAWAHVTLEQAQAAQGSTYKAVLRVGHGCEGLPTTAIRVELPADFQRAKPMPKHGWSLSSKTAKLAQSYDDHGTQITEDVTEITWTAKSPEFALQDSEYDEFVLRGRAAMPVGAAWFKVTQLCQEGSKTGRNPWTEVPASGTSTRGLKYPAALLNVTAAPSAPAALGHQGHGAASAPVPPAASSTPTNHPHAGHKH